MIDTVVIGIGNLLLSDEGIGIHVVRTLIRSGREFPGVDLLDLGASGMDLFHKIAGRRKAILIDCALMDEAPGTIKRFTPDEVRSRKEVSALSFHEGDLLDILDLSKRVGEYPEEVVIFGIQPQEFSPSEDLSALLQERMTDYTACIEAELASGGRSRGAG